MLITSMKRLPIAEKYLRHLTMFNLLTFTAYQKYQSSWHITLVKQIDSNGKIFGANPKQKIYAKFLSSIPIGRLTFSTNQNA